MQAKDLKLARKYGGMRLQRVDTDTHELKLGEGKIIGENIIFNIYLPTKTCVHTFFELQRGLVIQKKCEHTFWSADIY